MILHSRWRHIVRAICGVPLHLSVKHRWHNLCNNNDHYILVIVNSIKSLSIGTRSRFKSQRVLYALAQIISGSWGLGRWETKLITPLVRCILYIVLRNNTINCMLVMRIYKILSQYMQLRNLTGS